VEAMREAVRAEADRKAARAEVLLAEVTWEEEEEAKSEEGIRKTDARQ